MGPINQHKSMASGGPLDAGDFGCKDINHCNGPSMGTGAMKGGHVSDSMRGAPPPVKHSRGKHKAQAQVDHGPHR